MPSSPASTPTGDAALRRIVRLAARALGAVSAEFVSFGDEARTVAHGEGPGERVIGTTAVVGLAGEQVGELRLLGDASRALGVAEQETLAEFGGLIAEVIAVEMRLLRAPDLRLREVIEGLPVVVYAADRDGRFTLSLGGGLTALEHRESAVGQSMYERYRDAPEILDPLRRAMAGAETRFSYRVQDVTYESRSLPVRDAQGEVVGLVGIAVDVTERVQAEAVLREAKAQAEETGHLKALFLTNMSHEIRTPLTAIIGFSELLADAVPAEHQDVADLVVRSGRRLLHTLNSVLDFARLEAEQVAVQLTPLDVAEEVGEAVRFLRPLAERKGLRLDVHAEGTPGPVLADAALLTRIVNNLVGNAIKFTDEGGVTVALVGVGGDVLLRVRDTGEGINEAFLPHLFDAFKQDQDAGARPREGSGLGLAITKRIVDLMDGTIEVASRKGQGTTFTVRLPLATEPADGAASSARAEDLRAQVGTA